MAKNKKVIYGSVGTVLLIVAVLLWLGQGSVAPTPPAQSVTQRTSAVPPAQADEVTRDAGAADDFEQPARPEIESNEAEEEEVATVEPANRPGQKKARRRSRRRSRDEEQEEDTTTKEERKPKMPF